MHTMNSKEYTDYLVEQLTELRDLIILIERGGNDTPDVLYKLALENRGILPHTCSNGARRQLPQRCRYRPNMPSG